MTTAAVVAYYTREREARISYAGHPPVLYKRSEQSAWSYAWPAKRRGGREGASLNIPLAIDSGTRYEEFAISLVRGDRLFVYTDGIIDTPDPAGESFGLARLKQVLDAGAAAPLPDLKSAVLGALSRHARTALTHDDLTLIALEIC